LLDGDKRRQGDSYMRLSNLGITALLLATPVWLGACGGGGTKEFSIPSQNLLITSTTITEAPQGGDVNLLFDTADTVDWEVPLSGGCGGPYVMSVLSGQLPDGISAVGGMGSGSQILHHLRGVLLQEGTFNFRLQVTDTNCTPFATTHADFSWTVARGGVAIVVALPALHATGTYDLDGVIQNPNYPAVPDAVYGQFKVYDFLVAGGVGPYEMFIVDDPTNPDDGFLPLGFAIPPSSTSIVGSSISFSDVPYLVTLQVRDSLGQLSPFLTVQFRVVAPPIVIGDTTLPNGQAGSQYSFPFTIVAGVPPFHFEFVRSDVNRDALGDPIVTYQNPLPPVIAPATANQRVSAADYPAQNLLGPDYRSFAVPPEGMFLGDVVGPFTTPGVLTGTPRRRGTFRLFLHVRSAIIPNVAGQHAWQQLDLVVAPSEPPDVSNPAFGQDPDYTVTGAFTPAPPYAPIADAEVGLAVYNPDTATHAPDGLQLLARGGVRKDGLTDAVHSSELTGVEGTLLGQEDSTTPGGGYDWTVNPNPAGDGDAYTALPPGMSLSGWVGIWRVANAALLAQQGGQALEFTVQDQQLPLQVRNSATQRVNFGVGPDKVIYTESTTSGTTSTASNWWDMNDGAQTVRVCLPYKSAPVVFRDLNATDLSPTHDVPSTTGLSTSTALATLLTAQDMLRVCVNPAGWWNDIHNLNPLGARSGIHADRNGYDNYIWGENDNGSSSDLSRQPSITCVDIPEYRPGGAPAVSHASASGVYTDGGKMYPFANSSYFGVFVVRSDASIYVPFAIGTSQSVGGLTFNGFGDGMLNTHSATGRSQLRIPHMAVSPDGRFAAMKIKTSHTNFFENASTTRIVVFSLTGEKAFGGETYCIVSSGSNGTTANGVYLYAASMVLTNTHLYYLCGNRNGTFTQQSTSREHYVYRFQVADPSDGSVVAGATGTGSFCPKADATDTNWTNTASAPLQTRFHLYSNPLVSGFATGANMHFDGSNLLENSICPMPFRVSADGRSIAVLAMPDQTVVNTNAQAWHVWVDFQGSGVRRLSTAPRHITGGGTRGYTLGRGSNNNTYENWHRYHGPTPHLEISDDGSKVAVVVNRYAGSPTYSSPTVSWPTAREDVIAYRTPDNVSWTELPITGDGATTNVFSATGSPMWRFGALVFTKNSSGLVFWGGFSSFLPTSTTTTNQFSHTLAGTLYGVDVSSATGITGVTVTSLLDATAGGSSVGVASFTTASPYAPTLPTGTGSTVAGVIKPYGGFLSRNREFLYMVNKGAISTGQNEYPLLGVNIRSTNTAANINGHTDFRGFAVGGWPARRGFVSGTYNYYSQYGLSLTDYPAYRKHGMGMQIMPKGTGWVLFGSHYQSSGPVTGTSASLGGPLYSTLSYDYSAYGGQIEGFNADVGGSVVRLSAFTGDTSIRRIHFLEPADGGSGVAFVYDTYTTTIANPSVEQLHYVGGIAFHPNTGANVGTPVGRIVEGSPGRISDSFAFGSTRDRLFYAAGSSTNENSKVFKEATFGPSGVTYRTLSSTNKRYNIIHAAR
jgi:hypothetical protein